MDERVVEALPVGSVVTTAYGNALRRFDDGWSPLRGGHWDRWTVHASKVVAREFRVVQFVVGAGA